jgi:two-component system, chemotaxis family, protein-glutamate methylesterase/glutaminase
MHPSMPLNALQNVEVDYKAKLAEIPALLGRLTREEAPRAPELPMEDKRKIEAEIRIAEQENALAQDILGKGELSPYTCPECHGVLARLGRIMRFRCHTGHAFSADTLLSSLTEQVESRLWDAVRAVDETVMLLNHMGEHLTKAGHGDAAERYQRKATEALERTKPIREVAHSAEQFSADDLRKTG